MGTALVYVRYAERRTDGQADGHDEASSGLLQVFRLDLKSVT